MLWAPAARAACVPNLNAATWGDRDDDLDGICNKEDPCPDEPDPNHQDPQGLACRMQAITVPAVVTSPTTPHQTYSGATITLKGIARYGGAYYKWDYGDGPGTTGWLPFGNAGQPEAHNLSARHAYYGNVNEGFVATLSVASDATYTNVVTASYPVKLYQSSDAMPSDPNQMDVRIAMAIDEGLWWLHTNMIRGRYEDTGTGYKQAYGYWAGSRANAETCAAFDAFQLHGSKPLQDYTEDPYVEDVRVALNYVLANAAVATIASGGYDYKGNPSDANRNTVGTWLGNNGTNTTYEDGICGVALASSGAPNRVAQTGPGYVYNQPYSAIVQDVVDWFSYGQAPGGGWHYSANYGDAGDGSTNQWPILAMTAGKDNMGTVIPQFVIDAIPGFLDATRYTTQDGYYGAWGYTAATTHPNVAKTAGGILGRFFLNESNNTEQVQAGFGLMYRRWGINTAGWVDYNLGYSYAMYGVMKATQKAKPPLQRLSQHDFPGQGVTGNSFDWYYTPANQTQEGLATNIVRRQVNDGSAATGSVTDYGKDQTPASGLRQNDLSTTLSTAWDVAILQKAVTTVPPKASICDCSLTWPANAAVAYNGACSSDADASRHIVSYQWDFNYDGSTFHQTPNPKVAGQGISGVTGVYSTGYPNFTEGVLPPTPTASYTVALKVTDDNPDSLGGPLTSVSTCTVHVKPPPHCPHPSAGGTNAYYFGNINKPIQLDASLSSDPDFDPLTFVWDINHTGIFTDPSEPAIVNPTVTFTTPGTYPIAVQVTDHPDQNARPYIANPCPVVDYAYVQVGANTPLASAGGPYTSQANQTVTLDATGSSDPDNLPLTYAWDLTGSGTYGGDANSNSAKPTLAVGNLAVGQTLSLCLKVSNGNKTSSKNCATLTVIATPAHPVCVVSQSLTASCNGGPVTVQVDGSNSYDINHDKVTYNWTTNCPGTFANTTTPGLSNLTINTAHMGCNASCTATLRLANSTYETLCQPVAINVNDTVPPVFSATPSSMTVPCDANAASAVNAWLLSAGATDVCAPVTGGQVSISNDFVLTNGCGGVTGPTKVTWTAQDICSKSNGKVQASATVTVTAPVPPVLTSPAAGAALSSTSTVVTGTAIVGSTLVTRVNLFDVVDGASNLVASNVVPGANGVFSVPLTFSYGAHSLTATQTLNGMASAASSAVAVTVAPVAPAITSPANNATQASTTVAVGGTALPHTTVMVYDNGTLLGIVQESGGHFSFTGTLTYGSHLLTVTQTINGIASLASPPVTVNVTPPPADLSGSGLPPPVAGLPTYLGNGGAGVTANLTVQGVAGESLTITDQGRQASNSYGPFTPDANGKFNASMALGYGHHHLTLTLSIAGLSSAQTQDLDVVPAAPAISSIGASATFLGDSASAPGSTVPLQSAGLPANATLNIADAFDSSNHASTVKADGTVADSATYGYGAHALTYSLSAPAWDGPGAVSSAAVHNGITVTPIAPAPSAPLTNAALVGTSISATGAAVPGATVSFIEGGKTIFTTLADVSGRYSSSNFKLAYGAHHLTVSQTANGQVSAPTNDALVSMRPEAPTLTSQPGPVSNSAIFTGVWSGSQLFGVPVVNVYGGATLKGTVPVGSDGHWTLNALGPPALFSNGPDTVTFTVMVNNVESLPLAGSWVLWTTPPALSVIAPWSDMVQSGLFQPIVWSVAASYQPPPGVTITNLIYTLSGGAAPATLYSGPPFDPRVPSSVDLSLLRPGRYQLGIAAGDNAGNSSLSPYQTSFTYSPSIPSCMTLTQRLLKPIVDRCSSPSSARDPACRRPLTPQMYNTLLSSLSTANALSQRVKGQQLWKPLRDYLNALNTYELLGRAPVDSGELLKADVTWALHQFGG